MHVVVLLDGGKLEGTSVSGLLKWRLNGRVGKPSAYVAGMWLGKKAMLAWLRETGNVEFERIVDVWPRC